VVEHFLHTEMPGKEQSVEPHAESERVTVSTEFCPEFTPAKRVRSGRLVRIARGLYRYGPNGTIYWCRTNNGKNFWKNLQTTDRTRAMAISAFNLYTGGQNGNTEITVLPVGMSPTPLPCSGLPGQPSEPEPRPTIAPASAPVPIGGSEVLPRGISLNRLVARFKSESQHLATATREKLDSHFKIASRYLDFERDVVGVKLADLRLLKSKLSEGRKPSSVNDILFKALGALFKIALEDEIIDRSPLEKLAHSRKVEPDRQQPPWEQSQAIVDSIWTSSSETGLIVGFMRNFGVGQAEIKYLLGEHINTDANVIHFRRKKTGKPFDVPIFPHAKSFIEALKAERRLQVGKPVVAWRNPRKAFATACERLNLPSYGARALRRCFIVHCLQEGIDPRLVAKWQGHRDAKLIFSVYGKYIDHDYELAQAGKLGSSGTNAAVAKNMSARPC